MIPHNALSIYLLQHNQNEICDQNIHSIQESMRLDDPSGSQFKHICTYFPNLVVLATSAMPVDIQVAYTQA